MNNAKTAAAWRMCAHSQNRNSGVRNIPPPVPVRPERKPRPAPVLIATGREGATVCGGALRRKTTPASGKSGKAPIRKRSSEGEGWRETPTHADRMGRSAQGHKNIYEK